MFLVHIFTGKRLQVASSGKNFMHRRRHYFESREDEGEELIRNTCHIPNIIPPKLLLNHSLFQKTPKGLTISKRATRVVKSAEELGTTFKSNLRGITLGL